MNSIRRSLVTSLARGSFLALTVAALGAAHADAQSSRYRATRSHWEAQGALVDVQVRVEGETLPLYFKPGTSDRHYFQAFRGRNYALVLTNNTSQRVGVVVAVDGLNVVNGDRSSLSRHEPMYVLDPHESATIRGWRTSLNEVRKFVFVDEERSYAERTGQANGDMGWIRVVSFREKQPLSWFRNEGRVRRDLDERSATPESAAPPSAAKPQAESFRGNGPTADANPGTGWGERSRDRVRETEFEAVRQATDHLVLRYEYAAGLRALGIVPGSNRLWDRERGNLGFAQPPRW